MTDKLIIFKASDKAFSELTKRLRSVLSKSQRDALFFQIASTVGVVAESKAREYPVPSRKPLPKFYTRTTAFGRPTKPYLSKFKSDKQAYFVIKLGEKGGIPYKRTGTLGKSITSRVLHPSNNLWVIEVGTNTPYAKKVIGDEGDQSHYHAGTWTPLRETVTNPTAIRDYNAVIRNGLQGAVGRLLP